MTAASMSSTAHPHKTSCLFERFADSQPVLNMMQLLRQAGRDSFKQESLWEVCLCSLILTIEPSVKLQKILHALPYKDTPMNEADLLNTMAHLGYVANRIHSSFDVIDERLMPALFIPSDGYPSILIGRDDNRTLYFFDPLSRLISHVPSSLDERGTIWLFQPYDEHRQLTSKFMRKGSGHSWFRALLGRFRGTFAQIMTASLILNIIALATPVFIMLVYDKVIAAGTLYTLPMLALGALIAIGFEWKLRNIRSQGLSWLAGRLDNLVSNKIFAHLIGLSPTLIEKASVAAQIARIKTFEAVRDFFSGSVFLSVLEAPFVIIAVVAIWMMAGSLVFVPLAFVIGYLTIFMLVRQQVKSSIRLAAKASSARQQFTIETFEKLEGIRSQGLADKWQEKFRHLSGREMMSHFHLNWLGMLAESLSHALTILAAVATVGFGVQMVWDGMMNTGALVATMMLVWRILTPFYSLCTMVPRLEQLRNSIQQVNQLIDVDTEAEEARSFARLSKVKGNVQFNQVTFSYTENSDIIFSDLNFQARAGDMVAITGSNGSGKASILKLVQALHYARQGSIQIDGFDIRQLDAPDLRRQIAYVPKQPHLFSGKLIDNLRFANPLATEEEIRRALDMANILEDVEKLEHGLHSDVDIYHNTGLLMTLKTGISLARGYLHPGNILLIDELPNTLLSGRAGDNLKDYLRKAKGKRTIFFCTYREDFMQLADSIIWLRASEKPIAGPRDMILSAFEGLEKKPNQPKGAAA